MPAHWYVIHTYAGQEARAKAALLERVKAAGREDAIEEIFIPEENVAGVVEGERRIGKRTLIPGFMLVKMDLDDEIWDIIKNTARITGFAGSRPSPIADREVRDMMGSTPNEESKQALPGAREPEPPGAEDALDSGGKKGGRGVETLFRTSYRTQLELTQLADTKANILISINGVLMTVTIGYVVPRITAEPLLLLPSLILLVGCLTSLGFAVVAARPRVRRTPITLEQVRENRDNVLFFGHFLSLSRDEFEEGLRHLMRNRSVLYDNMARDLYGLGLVLSFKYQHLRTGYTLFFATLAAGVTSFVFVLVTLANRAV